MGYFTNSKIWRGLLYRWPEVCLLMLLDAVMGGSLLLKNALGLTGVLLLGAILLFPICKVLALAIIYRLAAALIQPLGDTLLADTLEEMAGCLFLTFAAVAAVAIMFFAAITVIVGAANLTIMFR